MPLKKKKKIMDYNTKLDFTPIIGNYIDSLTKAPNINKKKIKKLIIMSLMTNIMELSVNEDKTYDYDAIEPIFSTVNHIFKREIYLKSENKDIPQINSEIQKLENITKYLDHRIKVISDQND